MFGAARIVRENSTSANVKIAESACAADGFFIRVSSRRHAALIIATHRHRPKALGADSESQILAIKKFSRAETSRLIGARQNPIFARIAES
jgi:hypothetical protein